MRSLRLRLLRSSLSFSFAPAPVAAPEPGSARSPFGCGVEVKDLSQSSVMIELERLEGVRASFALLLLSSMLLLLLLCCSSNDIEIFSAVVVALPSTTCSKRGPMTVRESLP